MNAITEPFSQTQGLLRFITCGSVDDGKSTLIGRLLHDAKGVFADQLSAISRAKHKRTVGEQIDFSLLTDGLEAEREQGITIDVAYRYFATPRRKFIIADCPGHEQYTRNMVTGASTAHAAVLLIDATRVQDGQLLAQTKRHAAIAKLLGVQHVIAAVNKMDLVGYSEAAFNQIAQAFEALAAQLGLTSTHIIPVSALLGENVAQRGAVSGAAAMPWYQGASLLELLELLPLQERRAGQLRFAVQLVIRTDGHRADDFRGLAGTVAAGSVAVGDEVIVQPSGAQAKVARIVTHDGDLQMAGAGDAITLVLDRDVDVSRGAVLIAAHDTAAPAKSFSADICWLDTQAFAPARKYWLKLGSKTVYAKIDRVDHVLDVHTLAHDAGASALALNAIGRVRITAQQALLADDYAHSPATSAFILIDPATHQTAAAGMVRPG
ncbi:MAG: sulfate adenylyltransferase subunit 1 [Burkholderiaceae bacterium]